MILKFAFLFELLFKEKVDELPFWGYFAKKLKK